MQELADTPALAVPYYLMSVYLYSEHAAPVLSDGTYDGLCQFLLDNWSTIEHRHKHLVDLEALQCHTTQGYRFDEWPTLIKSAALRWHDNHIAAMEAPNVKINDDNEIKYDGTCWKLSIAHHTVPTEEKPEGSTNWKNYYHGTFEQAVRTYIDKVAIGSCEELEQIVASIRAAYDGVILAVRAAKGEDLEHIKTKPTELKKRKPVPVAGAVEVTVAPVVDAGPTPVTNAVPTYTMTAKAGTATREDFLAKGWGDQQLIDHGYMIED